MSEKVIGMMTSYPNLTQCDWLWQQTPNHFGKWGNIRIQANAPEPDFLLMYQFEFHRIFWKKYSWRQRLKSWVKQEPLQPDIREQFRGVPQDRIIYLCREPSLAEYREKNNYNYEAAKQYCGYVSGPDPEAPIPDYMPAIWYHSNSFRELNEMEPPAKIKPCSWITSGVDRSQNHLDRLNFLKLLQERQINVDCYGRNLPSWCKNWGQIGNKWQAMAPYYYNLAIENYAGNDLYVTEKLWDALLAWCLPIYYGGGGADKLLPPGSFIRLPSLDEKGLEFIQEVTASTDYWYQAKDAISEARQIILHKLNLLNWLSEFVAK